MFNSENTLIKKAQDGNREAMAQLYKTHFKGLYIFIRSKVDCNERAEDICSEAFIKAFEKIGNFNFNSSFKSWLYTIGKNMVYDWYRVRVTEMKVDTENIESESSSVDFNEELETDDTVKKAKKEIRRILENLQDNYRKVLELRFLLNYSINETANEMGLSSGNVKVLQNRALKKAQQILFESK